MSDLEILWAKAWPQPIGPWDDLWKLRQAGVPQRSLLDIGALDIGIQNGRWAERFRGDRAMIVPVCDDAGDLLDLIAFRLETPRSFWTYDGAAAMLGQWNLEHAQYYEEPLLIHECPLDWLRAGCSGVVILEWKDFWPFTLAGIPALRCSSDDFGRRIKARMERPFTIPAIEVAA